jgi:hypothetical protein
MKYKITRVNWHVITWRFESCDVTLCHWVKHSWRFDWSERLHLQGQACCQKQVTPLRLPHIPEDWDLQLQHSENLKACKLLLLSWGSGKKPHELWRVWCLRLCDISREMWRGLIHRNSLLGLCILKSSTATSECCHQLQQGSLVPMHCKFSGEESSYSYVRLYQMNLLQKICKESKKIHREIWGSHSGDYERCCVLGHDVARPKSDWYRTGQDFGISVHRLLK